MRIYRFTITEEHLKLLRHMCVQWEDAEFGAPCIDPKRPYGNSSVLEDIREILGEPYEDRDRRSETQNSRYAQLHAETEVALQICLQMGEFKTGSFAREHMYSHEWKKT